MKVTLAFLFLGICLALTNARYVERKKMSGHEALSYIRMIALMTNKVNAWQNCQRCSEAERYCMEKAIVEHIFYIVTLMANDMRCTMEQLLAKAKFQFSVTFIINACQNNDIERFTQTLRAKKMMSGFVISACDLMNTVLMENNVDMRGALSSMSNIMGMNAFGVVDGILNSATGGFANVAAGALGDGLKAGTGLVHGVTNFATGALGDGLKAGTGLVHGVTNFATGALVDGLKAGTGLVHGVTKFAAGALGDGLKAGTGLVDGAAKGVLGALNMG